MSSINLKNEEQVSFRRKKTNNFLTDTNKKRKGKKIENNN
jgi:hypothetical protein